jgi:small nuclear ribonucleoprotein (snRNP)-like protein
MQQGGMKNAWKILVAKSEGKRVLGRLINVDESMKMFPGF